MEKPRYKSPESDEIFNGEFVIRDSHDRVVYNDDDEVLVGRVVDKDSVVKRNLGKLAYGAELSAGIEQLLHPEIGAAVEHTGKFWRNPYYRVAVSMDPIMAVVYADDPRAVGNYVRRLHEGIHGTTPEGKKFNALSPDAFYWAHETFRSGVEKTADFYSKDLFTDIDRENLQLESATWFSYYGMPMGKVPATVEANDAYRAHMIDDVLEMNPSAERAIDFALHRNPPRPESVPKRVWWLAKTAMIPVTELVSLVTIGEIDEDIRQKFGIPFSRLEKKKLEDIRFLTSQLVDSLPDSMRYSYIAYDSLYKERGGQYDTKTDQIVHTSMNLGSTALSKFVLPVAKHVQKRILR